MTTEIVVREPSAVAVATQSDTMMDYIRQAVSDPQVDVGKLRALLEMKREVEADEAKRIFKQALHDAQAAMPRVKKNGTIDLGKGKPMRFARWEDMDTVLRPVMEQHGFSLSFTTALAATGGMIITGRLEHVGGHYMEASMPLPVDTGAGRNALQAAGSSLSYGKRYIAEMLFNIVREGADDDGGRGGTKFITDAQIKEIQALLKETKSDELTILRMLFADKIQMLSECDSDQYATLKNALEYKRGLKRG